MALGAMAAGERAGGNVGHGSVGGHGSPPVRRRRRLRPEVSLAARGRSLRRAPVRGAVLTAEAS